MEAATILLDKIRSESEEEVLNKVLVVLLHGMSMTQ